ncbi:hypothetical protein G7K_0134-t1 [Saitoella complicata NRRL Y-17804]|uniref:Uncharacterized protein n=1 Tax=Saitoella complicata (strain BCRC 22490 / CBS 7301 / JCM 7358 / NBRC 10748 / NRRL Y-17804) TaxID=698492 RepID=A0A0E9N7X4_SAICN|nr:hypothetical protein G7K_0134-t1 [Saitoella complicata NRRL Y-17804]
MAHAPIKHQDERKRTEMTLAKPHQNKIKSHKTDKNRPTIPVPNLPARPAAIQYSFTSLYSFRSHRCNLLFLL